ncbi:MAG: hypothetical protein HYX27_22495 [Acidobacteria bacterium]|nr:hypothetical protein [Acidobacteriota bacterium]
MSCEYQLGMLVMRECGAPASGACGMCGRQICPMHTMMGDAGPACPQCASQAAGYEDNDDTDIAETRGQYFTQYGGAAQFGQRGFFSSADSAAMSQRAFGANPPAKQQRYDPKET